MKKTILAVALIGLSPLTMASDVSDANKVIYGKDNRMEVVDYPDAGFREYARSTAAMIKSYKLIDGDSPSSTSSLASSLDNLRGLLGNIDDLIDDLNNISLDGSSQDNASSESEAQQTEKKDYFTFDKTETLQKTFNTCSTERFNEQPTIARCSGFLVAKDILVTAGHCVRTANDCTGAKWVFDYVKGTEKIKKSNVFSCKRVIKQELRSSLFTMKDYAIIQLDREVEGREPLKVRRKGRIKTNAPLVVIGHPSGLPTKIADGAEVKVNGRFFKKANYFAANLDTYGGNSGSAVINQKTGEVEGILVQGARDYVGISCKRSNQLSDAKGQEKVFRIRKVKGLKDLI